MGARIAARAKCLVNDREAKIHGEEVVHKALPVPLSRIAD
jgi:hypothetical protein